MELYPLELEVVRLVEDCLRSHHWPLNRVPVRVAFGLKANTASRHKGAFDGKNGQGLPVGRAEAWFNLSYLHQNPKLVLSDIVPHECAHLFAAAAALGAGRKISEHGEEWKQWLSKLSATAMQKGYGWRGGFDDRACLLAEGGVAYLCSCEGNDRFHVFPLRNGPPAEPCGVCHQVLTHCPREKIPVWFLGEVDSLIARQMDKNLYGWLG